MWIKAFWDLEPSTSQGSKKKPQKVITLVVECPSSEVNLDSLTIKTDGESTSNEPNDFIDIPKDSYVFTLTPTNFKHIVGIPLIHPQLID